MKPLFASFAALALGACAVAAPQGTRTLGSDLAVGGGTYNSPGGLSVAAEVQNIGGKIGVCGVWAQSESQSVLTKFSAKNVLAKGVVLLNNEVILRGLDRLAEVPPAPSYVGQMGNCFVTEAPWTGGGEARISIPRQVVGRDGDLDLSEEGGFVVVFRPGGPSAHPSDPKPWD
ncbi:hypothetical protein KUD11_09160 [Roseovarius sp. LXJ103]|uniref:hypothetical protein n=1 Tax=Roseovarius carneus TaxID=2853164 RepID=UPI000D6064EB|nr:hypothetical protein [Roseovarius carneus]MBZ8118816.1 hypothetical protein [Roseovarius carneus]PWE35515.1 hypothetical protein DD563_05795 [Pelagicola sp. LXJ1103]